MDRHKWNLMFCEPHSVISGRQTEADGRTNRQTERCADGLTNQQTDRQIDRQIDRQAGDEIDRQIHSRVMRQIGRQIDREIERQIGRQADTWIFYLFRLTCHKSTISFTRSHGFSATLTRPLSVRVTVSILHARHNPPVQRRNVTVELRTLSSTHVLQETREQVPLLLAQHCTKQDGSTKTVEEVDFR